MRTLFIHNKKEIHDIIKSCKICFLAMSVDDVPYALPMNFAIHDDIVILHSGQSGRMWETLHKNPRACIVWNKGEEMAWQNEQAGCSYRMKSKSVIIEGPVEFVEEYHEKVRCLHILMSQYSKNEFKFNPPAVRNVGMIKVHIEKISAKEFGAKAVTPWS